MKDCTCSVQMHFSSKYFLFVDVEPMDRESQWCFTFAWVYLWIQLIKEKKLCILIPPKKGDPPASQMEKMH